MADWSKAKRLDLRHSKTFLQLVLNTLLRKSCSQVKKYRSPILIHPQLHFLPRKRDAAFEPLKYWTALLIPVLHFLGPGLVDRQWGLLPFSLLAWKLAMQDSNWRRREFSQILIFSKKHSLCFQLPKDKQSCCCFLKSCFCFYGINDLWPGWQFMRLHSTAGRRLASETKIYGRLTTDNYESNIQH